jgi:hypothetical protein
VILGCAELSKDWLVAQKLVKDSAPDEIHSMHETDNLLITFLRDWVDRRTPPGELAQAHLQLNVAMSATMTAFTDWSADKPFEEFLATATDFLHQLGRAFPC